MFFGIGNAHKRYSFGHPLVKIKVILSQEGHAFGRACEFVRSHLVLLGKKREGEGFGAVSGIE